MNKVKLKLASTQIFDETIIVDIFYNQTQVIESTPISSDGSEIVFDVADTPDLYNNIKISIQNFFDLPTDFVNIKRNEDFSSKKSTKIEYFEDITLFLYGIEISNDDGKTWIDVSPFSQNNPQNICLEDEQYIYTRIISEFVENSVYVDINKNIFGKNNCFVITKDQVNVFIPSAQRTKNIDTIIVDNIVYDDLLLDTIKKRNGTPEEYEYKSIVDNEKFELIKSKYKTSQPKKLNKTTNTLE